MEKQGIYSFDAWAAIYAGKPSRFRTDNGAELISREFRDGVPAKK